MECLVFITPYQLAVLCCSRRILSFNLWPTVHTQKRFKNQTIFNFFELFSDDGTEIKKMQKKSAGIEVAGLLENADSAKKAGSAVGQTYTLHVDGPFISKDIMTRESKEVHIRLLIVILTNKFMHCFILHWMNIPIQIVGRILIEWTKFAYAA